MPTDQFDGALVASRHLSRDYQCFRRRSQLGQGCLLGWRLWRIRCSCLLLPQEFMRLIGMVHQSLVAAIETIFLGVPHY